MLIEWLHSTALLVRFKPELRWVGANAIYASTDSSKLSDRKLVGSCIGSQPLHSSRPVRFLRRATIAGHGDHVATALSQHLAYTRPYETCASEDGDTWHATMCAPGAQYNEDNQL